MSMLEQSSQRERPRRRRSGWPGYVRWAVLAAALVLVFLVGIAFGQALDDGPDPSGVTTSVRTLTPIEQERPPRIVTVTVTQEP